MSEAEKILELVVGSHKHRMACYLNDTTKEMVLDAINIALLIVDKNSIPEKVWTQEGYDKYIKSLMEHDKK